MKRGTTKSRRSANPGGPLERQARASLRAAAVTAARVERTAPRALGAAAEAVIACLEGGGTVFFCGNGGSAADAEHLAGELSGRYLVDRPALSAVSLTANTAALTAIANDYGFDQVFSRPLSGMGKPGDVLVAITTSGRSPNVRRAVETAHGLGMVVIGLTGQAGASFAALCDHALVTPVAATPRVQEGHIVMGHILCELVERALLMRAVPPDRARSRRGARRAR